MALRRMGIFHRLLNIPMAEDLCDVPQGRARHGHVRRKGMAQIMGLELGMVEDRGGFYYAMQRSSPSVYA